MLICLNVYLIQTLITIRNHHHFAQAHIHLSNRRENTYLQSLRETLSTDRDRWRKALLCCSAPMSTVASTHSSHSSRNTPGEAQKTPSSKSNVLTVPSKSFPWMQLSKSKPGARNSHCIAFWDVLGILLLLFTRVPRAADLHDCAVFSKMLWKETLGGRQKTWSV